jgi:hypothetical protein
MVRKVPALQLLLLPWTACGQIRIKEGVMTFPSTAYLFGEEQREVDIFVCGDRKAEGNCNYMPMLSVARRIRHSPG